MKEIKWNYKIGQVIKDGRRYITIIDKEIRESESGRKWKYYRYHCNKCGCEDWMAENNLTKEKGCKACAGRPVLGINTIWDLEKWMIPYVGEEISKKYTRCSNHSFYPICPICGRKKTKEMAISTLYRTHSIGCSCGDGISIPSKIMFHILEQLQMDFKTEYSPSWISPRRYDFYIPSMNLIIEMDGRLGHGNDGYKNSITAEESTNIDDYKDKLAMEHGIEVIRIDCRYNSNDKIEYVKRNILQSKLATLFDLSIINWNDIGNFAYSSLTKVACDYKRNNPDLTTTEIAVLLNVDVNTINRWLKFGNLHNMCTYNPKEEQRKAVSKNGINNGKLVGVFKENINLGIFYSLAELERQSEKLFGIKIFKENISKVCRGERKTTGGFHFKFIKDLTSEEYIKYDIQNKLNKLNNGRT